MSRDTPRPRAVRPRGRGTLAVSAGTCAVVLQLVLGGTLPAFARAPVVVPARLSDVQGQTVDVASLAAGHTLVFVTLKAPSCPVCKEQLRRLTRLLPRLRTCGATFVVLAPGPADVLAAVAQDSAFPYPFVEDRNLALARAADLALGPGEIAPAIFTVNAAREIVWMQRGRSSGHYGDAELLAHLGCGTPDAPDLVASSRAVAGGA